MYESRAYDVVNDDGFPPDPVVVLVVTGTHDVSRLLNLLNGGTAARRCASSSGSASAWRARSLGTTPGAPR